MATKKQKREAAAAKHEQFMASVSASGLEAQRKDKQQRAAQAQRAKDDAERRKRAAKAKPNTKAIHKVHGDV